MKQILGWVVVLVTALFVAFNLESAEIWFFGVRARMPVAFLVIAAAGLGAFASYAFTSLTPRKK